MTNPLAMTADEREALERIARSASAPERTLRQAKALLLVADGVGTNEVARRCGTTDTSVRAWRRRFAEQGVEGVGRIEPGRGRRPWLPEGTVATIVHDTLHETPGNGAKRWTTRAMARRLGIGKDTVARIWRAHEIEPWRSDPSKSQDEP
jgi:transposase